MSEIPYGYCHCRCGQKTPLAQKTSRRAGWTKGEPTPYARGHQGPRVADPYVVDADTGCWIWLLARDKDGYGKVKRAGRSGPAHRWYYEQAVGDVPVGLVLHHRCENRACVNPDHLEPLSVRDNTLRSTTAPSALNAIKTHCLRGHPLSGDNLHVQGGRRICRTCRQVHSVESLRRRVERGQAAAYQRQYRVQHGDRARARGAVRRALDRGDLQRPECCEECGGDSTRIEAHHDDYSKPLEVRWLCVYCHRIEHLPPAPPPADPSQKEPYESYTARMQSEWEKV